MGVDEIHEKTRHRCPCYNAHREFTEVVDVLNTGIVIYYHTPFKVDVSYNVPKSGSVGATQLNNAIIIENPKGVNIKAENLTKALENFEIRCPRCRYIYQHVRNLLKEVCIFDKDDLIGICDHCNRMKTKSKDHCKKCESIVAKFKLFKTSKVKKNNLEFDRHLSQKNIKATPNIEDVFKKPLPHTLKVEEMLHLDTDGTYKTASNEKTKFHIKVPLTRIDSLVKQTTTNETKVVNYSDLMSRTRDIKDLTSIRHRTFNKKYDVVTQSSLSDIKISYKPSDFYSLDHLVSLKEIHRQHQIEPSQIAKKMSTRQLHLSCCKNVRGHYIYILPKPGKGLLKSVEIRKKYDKGLKSSKSSKKLTKKQFSFYFPKNKSSMLNLVKQVSSPSLIKQIQGRYHKQDEINKSPILDGVKYEKKGFGSYERSSLPGNISKSFDYDHENTEMSSKIQHKEFMDSSNTMQQYVTHNGNVTKSKDTILQPREYMEPSNILPPHATQNGDTEKTKDMPLIKTTSKEGVSKSEAPQKIKETTDKQANKEKLINVTDKNNEADIKNTTMQKQAQDKGEKETNEAQKYSKEVAGKKAAKESLLQQNRSTKTDEFSEDNTKAASLQAQDSRQKDGKRKQIYMETFKKIKTESDKQDESKMKNKEALEVQKNKIKEVSSQKYSKEVAEKKTAKESLLQQDRGTKKYELSKDKTTASSLQAQDLPTKDGKKNQNDMETFQKLKAESDKDRETEMKNKNTQEIEENNIKVDYAQKAKHEMEQQKAKDLADLKKFKDEKSIIEEHQGNKSKIQISKGIPMLEEETRDKTNKNAQFELEQLKKLKDAYDIEKETAVKNKHLQEIEVEKLKESVNKKGMIDADIQDVFNKLRSKYDGAHLSQGQKIHLKRRALTIDRTIITQHKYHHTKNSSCELCNDSLLELEIQSIELKKAKVFDEDHNIIIGEKIFKYNKPLQQLKGQEDNLTPVMAELIIAEQQAQTKDTAILEIPQDLQKKKTKKNGDHDAIKGVIKYALSDRSFIEKGWTKLPTEKIVRKMNVYRMRPSHLEFDWFEHNKHKKLMNYDNGSKLAEFDEKGRGRLYYKSGQLALDYYDAEETNAQQRFVVYSSGEPDERGRSHPVTVLATFDYLGNGIVFDHGGKIRLKYNQTEGVVLDRSLGPVSHWKWHTMNDPPVLQQVMIDTQMAHKDPNILKLDDPSESKRRPDNEEMLAIEFENFIKEKSKKLNQKFKPFQIKMKALKINEYFSLRVLDQATIYLLFRDGSTNIKLNIGMILDSKEIVDTDTADLGQVSNSLERFPARTESIASMQRSVAYAQRYERARSDYERRLCRPEPVASADQLLAGTSRPLRIPLLTVPTSSSNTGYNCRCKKVSNMYYNSRIV